MSTNPPIAVRTPSITPRSFFTTGVPQDPETQQPEQLPGVRQRHARRDRCGHGVPAGDGHPRRRALAAMSADDQRNTMIVKIGAQTGMGVELQTLINLDLTGSGDRLPSAARQDIRRGGRVR